MSNEIPRRMQVDKMEPVEKSLLEATIEIEKLPPHPWLTDAVVLVQQARDKVSAYIDGTQKD